MTVRARAHVETMGRSKSRIVITELPYQVNKTNLISKIADLHREGRLEGLTDLRDESDRTGMRIIVETTRNVEVGEVLAELYRLTPMESTFSIIMIALVNGEPRVLTLKQALRHYLDHRLEGGAATNMTWPGPAAGSFSKGCSRRWRTPDAAIGMSAARVGGDGPHELMRA